MTDKTAKRLAVLILGFGVASALFIMTIPPLFSSPEPYQVWLTAILGAVTTGLGVAVVLARPARGTPMNSVN